jgi:hypothetical protein
LWWWRIGSRKRRRVGRRDRPAGLAADRAAVVAPANRPERIITPP